MKRNSKGRMQRLLTICVSGIICVPALAQQSQPAPSHPGSAASTGHATTTTTVGNAPVAGKSTLGVSTVEMQNVVLGWSAGRDLIGKIVYNDQKDRIGKIDDLIITPAGPQRAPAASYAIVGVGGFLGMGKHDVAIPMEQLHLLGTQLTLTGATKDSLKNLPAFEYAHR